MRNGAREGDLPTEARMRYPGIRGLLPAWLRRYILNFEAVTEDAVEDFARALADGARVLDAGAGEAVYAPFFRRQRYVGVDLGVGDEAWQYSRLDAVADLAALPFKSGSFDACIHLNTLEHVPEPRAVLGEISRTLAPGGRLLLVVPFNWEVHQAPYDFTRFTRYGLQHHLLKADFVDVEIRPVGGFFRFLARHSLNALRFFSGVWFFVAAAFVAVPGLLLPLLDGLDRERDFTLGYVCTARRR